MTTEIIPPIPGSIAKAIFAIKQTVEAIRKDQRNEHGKYDYTSTDAVYAALSNKMGKVGLAILALEHSIEIVPVETRVSQRDGTVEEKTVRWLKAAYQFIFVTETDTWTHDKLRRTVMAQISGPQTFQAVESFASKAFLRATFKLPTGERDLDAMPDDFAYASVFDRPPPPPPLPIQETTADEAPGAMDVVWDDSRSL